MTVDPARLALDGCLLTLIALAGAGCYDSVGSEDGNASAFTTDESGDDEADDGGSSTGDDGSSTGDEGSSTSDEGSSTSDATTQGDTSTEGDATSTEGDTTGDLPSNGYYVQGNEIHDANDQVHVFRGIDRPSLEWNSNGEGISQADIELIAGWNANVVRIALNQGFWLEGSVVHDPSYRQRIDQVIEWSKAAGMDVIVDLHWSDRGDLAQMPGQQRMADQNSRTFWQSVADRYKDDGRVLFELYNEPHDVTWSVWLDGGDSGDGFQVVGMQELYDTVRGTGADNLVLIGGLRYAYDLSGVPDHRVEGYNIVYTSHPYDFADKQPPAWNADWGFLAESDPIFVTEFGSFNCNPGYAQQVIDYAEQRGLSWSAWAWYPGGCNFPALIENWSGTPSAVGQIVMTGLQAN
ncbi:cellulase family glycosylhydrolase [Nannocystaceae bacterium ST9]